MHLTKILIDAS